MNDPLQWSERSNPNEWVAPGTGMMESPFDMELILRACPELLKVWKLKPFILDVSSDGGVVVRYVEARDE